MVLLILFIVFMCLWFISLLPAARVANGAVAGASGWFAFISVILLFLIVHGVRVGA